MIVIYPADLDHKRIKKSLQIIYEFMANFSVTNILLIAMNLALAY